MCTSRQPRAVPCQSFQLRYITSQQFVQSPVDERSVDHEAGQPCTLHIDCIQYVSYVRRHTSGRMARIVIVKFYIGDGKQAVSRLHDLTVDSLDLWESDGC